MPTYQNSQNSNSSSSSSSTTDSSTVSEEQELMGNQAIADIIRQQNSPTGERQLNPNKNGIVFMGLNEYAVHEGRALNAANRNNGGAITALPQEEQDHLKHKGVVYDLSTEAGAASYVATLGLPDHLAMNAAQFLFDAGVDSRDELAQLVRILSEAEMGERHIERIVLSGHSIGSGLFGYDNGSIPFSSIDKLMKMFPKAASQIKHFMLSACYAGSEVGMNKFREMFPAAESILAYHKSSPGTWTGAIDHMNAWEKETEPGKDPANIDPSVTKGYRKSGNTSTWNVVDGYQGGKPMSIYQLEQNLTSQEAMFQAHFAGEQLVANAQSGPLRDYYALLQRVLGHPEAGAALVEQMSERRDVTIRLLYFPEVCHKFQEHYSNTLESGYRQAGIEMPDFASMNRKEFLEHLEQSQAALANTSALNLLQNGLKNLDQEVIPETWV